MQAGGLNYSHSFFAGGRLKCSEVMHMGYLWLTECSAKTTQIQTGHSKPTVSAYRNFFRQLVSEMIETDDCMIGGPGVIVQIDETKMGKRKYHRGHRVDGAWVLVGVESTVERLVFAEVVPDRREETLTDVINRHVCAGSIIWTDMWKGYAALSKKFDVQHDVVNHSRSFKSDTGVNTNTVEGTNYAIKRAIPPRNRTRDLLPSHLLEFVWRRRHEQDLWSSFIAALKDVSYASD